MINKGCVVRNTQTEEKLVEENGNKAKKKKGLALQVSGRKESLRIRKEKERKEKKRKKAFEGKKNEARNQRFDEGFYTAGVATLYTGHIATSIKSMAWPCLASRDRAGEEGQQSAELVRTDDGQWLDIGRCEWYRWH